MNKQEILKAIKDKVNCLKTEYNTKGYPPSIYQDIFNIEANTTLDFLIDLAVLQSEQIQSLYSLIGLMQQDIIDLKQELNKEATLSPIKEHKEEILAVCKKIKNKEIQDS